ncbi:MAG: GtrA family protein [Candidatus Saccharimonadales bacterium]
MKAKQKKSLIKAAIEFVKLQLAGNVLFWGTYIGYFVSDKILHRPSIMALAVASLIAHALFFVINREWIFSDKTGDRKTRNELVRFIIFMGLNFCINLGIIAGLETYLGLSPYVGQFVAGLFFTVWTFVGLKFWVFHETKRHHALTIDTPKRTEKRRARIRAATKQKTT